MFVYICVYRYISELQRTKTETDPKQNLFRVNSYTHTHIPSSPPSLSFPLSLPYSSLSLSLSLSFSLSPSLPSSLLRTHTCTHTHTHTHTQVKKMARGGGGEEKDDSVPASHKENSFWKSMTGWGDKKRYVYI